MSHYFKQEREERLQANQEEPCRVDQGVQLTNEKIDLVRRWEEVMSNMERKIIPALRGIQQKKLMKELRFVNGIIAKVKTREITASNDLAYAALVVVTKWLGVKIGKRSKSGEPMWKRKLEGQILVMSEDLSRLEMLAAGNPSKTSISTKV